MEIQIYGGINQIGGNKIFIDIEDKHFLFDFGLSFSDSADYFGDFLKPRKLNGILDYLYLNLIPPVDKIYREDYVKPKRFADVLNKYNITSSNNSKLDGFFLTHPHLDHYRFAGMLRRDTPIYMNSLSIEILKYINNTASGSPIDEFLTFYEKFQKIPYVKKSGMKRKTKSDYDKTHIKRDINTINFDQSKIFNTGKKEIQISSVKVDHSIPGCAAYIIENDGLSLIYTGDFRKHGKQAVWIDKFVEIAKQSNPRVIITEGTNIPSLDDYRNNRYKDGTESEQYVFDESYNEVRQQDGLVFVNFPIRNLDRILTYSTIAEKTDRIFAVPSKIFIYLQKMHEYADSLDSAQRASFLHSYPLPDLQSSHIKLYLRRKGWGLFENRDYGKNSQKLMNSIDYINYKKVQNEPERYLLYLNFYMLPEIIDIDPDPGTTLFLSSTTDPFDEEMEIQEKRLESWLERFKIEKSRTIHSSGHCMTDDLVDVLNIINADYVVPIHTENMDTFPELGLNSKILKPEYGKKIPL